MTSINNKKKIQKENNNKYRTSIEFKIDGGLTLNPQELETEGSLMKEMAPLPAAYRKAWPKSGEY